MRSKIKLLPVLSLAVALSAGISAQPYGEPGQTAIVSAGGSARNATGKFSFSIGQVNQQYAGDTYQMNQGIQQPYEFVVVATEDPSFNAFECNVYPNPVSSNLTISIGQHALSPFNGYRLIISDATGRTVSTRNLSDPISEVSVANLTPGNYFIQVMDDDDNYAAFQIIKI